jgi:hypothetical protein
VQSLAGLAAFYMLVVLPFFVAGAVDSIGIAVNVLLDAAAGAAREAAFFLFLFDNAAAEGTMGGGQGAV